MAETEKSVFGPSGVPVLTPENLYIYIYPCSFLLSFRSFGCGKCFLMSVQRFRSNNSPVLKRVTLIQLDFDKTIQYSF